MRAHPKQKGDALPVHARKLLLHPGDRPAALLRALKKERLRLLGRARGALRRRQAAPERRVGQLLQHQCAAGGLLLRVQVRPRGGRGRAAGRAAGRRLPRLPPPRGGPALRRFSLARSPL